MAAIEKGQEDVAKGDWKEDASVAIKKGQAELANGDWRNDVSHALSQAGFARRDGGGGCR